MVPLIMSDMRMSNFLGDGDRQASLVCCSLGMQRVDVTAQLNGNWRVV